MNLPTCPFIFSSSRKEYTLLLANKNNVWNLCSVELLYVKTSSAPAWYKQIQIYVDHSHICSVCSTCIQTSILHGRNVDHSHICSVCSIQTSTLHGRNVSSYTNSLSVHHSRCVFLLDVKSEIKKTNENTINSLLGCMLY